MFAARANLKRVSDTYRAEPEAGADFAYEPRHLATTASER
jgi:hypothetical protein